MEVSLRATGRYLIAVGRKSLAAVVLLIAFGPDGGKR